MAGNKDDEDSIDMSLSFVAAIFDDVKSAEHAYSALKDINREGIINIWAAAYMEKTDRSKVKVHEYKDWSGKKGLLAGGTAGAVIGVIGSTILLPVAVGALIGGTLSKVHDTKFSDKDLRQIANALPAGSSALVAIVEDEFVEPMETELDKQGGKKVHSGEIPNSTANAMANA